MLAGCGAARSSSETTKPTIVVTPTSTPAVTTASSVPTTDARGGSIDPCALMTAADASRLAGAKLILSSTDGARSGYCTYGSTGSVTTAEIVVKVDPDDAYAQADYPAWVNPGAVRYS